MATIHVPDALLDEVEALVEQARLARLAEIDQRIAVLTHERQALLGEASAEADAGGGRPAATDDDVLRAIRAGATNASQIAAVLRISRPTASSRVNALIAAGRVRAEGERRARRLSAV